MISLTNSGVPFITIADDTLKSGYKLVLYTPEELTKTFCYARITMAFSVLMIALVFLEKMYHA